MGVAWIVREGSAHDLRELLKAAHFDLALL